MLRSCAGWLSTRDYSRQFGFWTLLIGSLAGLTHACILDDERCDANQIRETAGMLDYCKCAPGTIPDPKGYGCMRCGEHEVVKNGKCECDEGYAKPEPTDACEEITGQAIGAECSDEMMCTEPYPYCATDDSEKYCSKRDCGDDDCPSGYTCETRSDAKFCAKLPSGVGEACMSNDDCADYDADECDTFNKKCILAGCATGKVKCPNTWTCCDISMLVPGLSVCGSPDMGVCPGKVVPQ